MSCRKLGYFDYRGLIIVADISVVIAFCNQPLLSLLFSHFPRPGAPACQGQPQVLRVPTGEAEKRPEGWNSKREGTREKRHKWEEKATEKEGHLSADPREEEVWDALSWGGQQNGEEDTGSPFLRSRNTLWFELWETVFSAVLLFIFLSDPPQAEPAVLQILWQQPQPQVCAVTRQAAGWVGSALHCPLPRHHLRQWNWDGQETGEATSKHVSVVSVHPWCCMMSALSYIGAEASSFLSGSMC